MIETKIRDRIRLQHKSSATADAYVHWFGRFLSFCKSNGIGSETKAEKAVEKFLAFLAVKERVSANTQNQAFSGLCYVYREVLNRPLVDVAALRAKRPDRTRSVCDQSELKLIFQAMTGPNLLGCQLMYAAGLRSGELGCIRINDIDFNRRQIHIWGAKGAKDRLVQFPSVIHEAVQLQIESVRVLWKMDVSEKLNGVSLPDAWGRKSPTSRLDFAWYYLFASDSYSRCPHSGNLYRHHRDQSGYSKALKDAVRKCGIPKRITPHCLRHSFASHSIEGGVPIHTLKELLGHTSIETTETYLHVSKDGVTAAESPLEKLTEETPTVLPFKLRIVG
jgi:integron integrase